MSFPASNLQPAGVNLRSQGKERSLAFRKPTVARILATVLLLFLAVTANAQTDTANKVQVLVQNAGFLSAVPSDSGSVQKLVGDVRLQQGTTQMLCDSAYINISTNNLEAFGTVRILQPGGTSVSSDYLRYTGNTRIAFLRGNVALTDGKSSLYTEELTYNAATRVGVYAQGGNLQSDATNVSSNTGNYNLNTKDARFTGNVYITDPQYNVVSDDLGYNTASKFVRFLGPSQVTFPSGAELRTGRGTYDSKPGLADFTARSSYREAEQYIEADNLTYARVSGKGRAKGNVVVLDTIQRTVLWCGLAFYNEKARTVLSTVKPVLLKAKEKDSLYVAADTFYSAPDLLLKRPPGPDSLRTAKPSRQSRGTRSQPRIQVPDTLALEEPPADSTAPRYFTGYHHVRIWSDSLQGRADSMSYSARDSVLRMMKDPVAWSRRSQISGDTILLYTDSSRLRRLYVPAAAFVASRSGPEKASFFDQIQGKTLTADFDSGTLRTMLIQPAAQSIYFATDDAGRYLGVNEGSGERIRAFFANGQLDRVVYEQEVKQTITPIRMAVLGNMRLPRFRWREDERPKSRKELFD